MGALTKNNNCFLSTRNGVTFSTDPANPTGKNQYSHAGFINQNAVAITADKPSEKKANNVAYTLTFNKRQRFLNKTRQASKTAKAVPEGFKLLASKEVLNIKSGVHTAAKVIRKRYANKAQGLTKLNLKKLALLNKAA